MFTTVTLSSKYQVVVPREVREALSLKAGTKLMVSVSDNHIELKPLPPLSDLYGIAPGAADGPIRDKHDRI